VIPYGNLLCQLYRHLMPHISCFHGRWIEDNVCCSVRHTCLSSVPMSGLLYLACSGSFVTGTPAAAKLRATKSLKHGALLPYPGLFCIQSREGHHGCELESHLQDVIQPVAVTSRRRLRSTSSSALVVPVTRRTTIGDRAFAVAGPRAWNSVPQFVTDRRSPGTFRKYLKTYLFSLSF